MNSFNNVLIDYSLKLASKYLYLSNKSVKYNKVDDLFETVSNIRNYDIKVYKYNDYIKAIKNFKITKYKLSFEEKKLILLLIGLYFNSINGINIFSIAFHFHKIPHKAIEMVSKILNYRYISLKKNILMLQKEDLNYDNPSPFFLNNLIQIKEIFISPYYLSKFLSIISHKDIEPYSIKKLSNKYDNIDMIIKDIENIIRYVFYISKINNYNEYNVSSEKYNIYKSKSFLNILDKFVEKIKKSELNIYLKDFITQNKLSYIELVFLMYLIYRIFIEKETTINNIDVIFSNLTTTPSQMKEILNILKRDSIFIKNKFISSTEIFPIFDNDYEYYEEIEDNEEEFYTIDNDNDSGYDIPLNSPIEISKDKIYKLFFQDINETVEKEKKKISVANKNTINKNLFEIIKPNVNLNSVILDDELKNDLLNAVDLTKSIEILKEWEVKPNLSADSFGSIKILFYGKSGTGKTLTAKALAGEANAELFKVDASNLVSSWVGESSKNVKRVFKEFKNYQENSDKKVFLFFNEADQLLSSRGTIMQAADKEHNQMQNILLEELENFNGVFIATTNLPDLLDSAWNRRFNIKIKFDIPKYETRIKLWKLHLTNKMPLHPDVDITKLAKYEAAGGAIANAVYNAARKAALREEKIIYHKDFVDAIENELKINLGERNIKVGF